MKIELDVLVYEHNQSVNGWTGEAKTVEDALLKLKYVYDDFKKYKDKETHFSIYDDCFRLAYRGGYKKLKKLKKEYDEIRASENFSEDDLYDYFYRVYDWLVEDNLLYHDGKSVVGKFVGTTKAVDDFCDAHSDDEHYYSRKVLKSLN